MITTIKQWGVNNEGQIYGRLEDKRIIVTSKIKNEIKKDSYIEFITENNSVYTCILGEENKAKEYIDIFFDFMHGKRGKDRCFDESEFVGNWMLYTDGDPLVAYDNFAKTSSLNESYPNARKIIECLAQH